MTVWTISESQRAVPVEAFNALQPEDVLYEFEVPCIFTFRMSHGGLALAYLSDDEDALEGLRYIVATTSDSTIIALKTGEISVRDALERGSLWIVDTDYQSALRNAYETAIDELPHDALPAAATMLWAHLEPDLVIRLTGPDLLRGSIPSAAIVQAAEIASTLLKPLVEWATGRQRDAGVGRPSSELQRLYTLPVQRLAHGSLVVSFKREESVEADQTKLDIETVEQPSPALINQKVSESLRLGLNWLSSETPAPRPEHVDDEQWGAILESLKKLTPKTHGPVQQVFVTGALVGRAAQVYTLTQRETKTVNSALTQRRRSTPSKLRTFTGRIGEYDRDKLTFIVRDSNELSGEIPCQLVGPELDEMVLQALSDGAQVILSARLDRGPLWTISDIEYMSNDEHD